MQMLYFKQRPSLPVKTAKSALQVIRWYGRHILYYSSPLNSFIRASCSAEVIMFLWGNKICPCSVVHNNPCILLLWIWLLTWWEEVNDGPASNAAHWCAMLAGYYRLMENNRVMLTLAHRIRSNKRLGQSIMIQLVECRFNSSLHRRNY